MIRVKLKTLMSGVVMKTMDYYPNNNSGGNSEKTMNSEIHKVLLSKLKMYPVELSWKTKSNKKSRNLCLNQKSLKLNR